MGRVHTLTSADRSRGGHARAAKLREQKDAARHDVEEQLRGHVGKAVLKLGEVLDSSDERVVVAAAKEILDRVLGRPVQAVAGDGETGPLQIILRSAFANDPAEDDDARA